MTTEIQIDAETKLTITKTQGKIIIDIIKPYDLIASITLEPEQAKTVAEEIIYTIQF